MADAPRRSVMPTMSGRLPPLRRCLGLLGWWCLASSAHAQSPPPPDPAAPTVECSRVATREPVVALTFDDGPHATLTPRLLDVLKAYGVHATFFVVGMNVEQNPEVLRRIAAEGHEVGNHSWSHPNLAKLPEEAWRAQLQETHDLIRRTVGQEPRFMRPPYGDLTPAQAGLIAAGFGYRVILWSVDPDDWKEPSRPVLLHRVLAGAGPGAIILLHDIHAPTVAAVPALIESLQRRGLRCVTVSELLASGGSPSSSPSPVP